MDLGSHDEFFDACFALGDHDGLMIDVTTRDLAFLDELSPFGDVPKPPVPTLGGSFGAVHGDQLAALRGGSSGSSGPPLPVSSMPPPPGMAHHNAMASAGDAKVKMSSGSRKQVVPMNGSLLEGTMPPGPKVGTFGLPMSSAAYMTSRQPVTSSRRSSAASAGSGSVSKAGRRKSSEFRGVSFNYKSQKWKSVITVNKVQKFLGYFDTEVEAAKKYDEASKKWRGNTGRLNFPDGVVPVHHHVPSKPPARHTVSKAVPHRMRQQQQQQQHQHQHQHHQHQQHHQGSGSGYNVSKSSAKVVPRHPYDFGPSASYEDLGMFNSSFGGEVPHAADNFAPVFPAPNSFSPLISPFASPMTSPRVTGAYESVQKDVFSKMHSDSSRSAGAPPTKRRPNLELQIPPEASSESGSEYGSPRKKQRPTVKAESAASSESGDKKQPCPGVSYCKQTGRYRCDVNVNGMHSCVGFFDSEAEAVRAYDKFAASAGQSRAPKPDSPSDRNLSPKTADLVRKSRNLNIAATPTASSFF